MMQILALASLLACAQEETWKTDFALSVERVEGEYVFVVEGTTNLPPGTELRARVYAIDEVEAPGGGIREDEEPLVWEDNPAQPALRVFTAPEGTFREEVYRFVRRPWAIRYRARVHYLPRFQSEEVLARVGEAEFSAAADLRMGNDEEYEAQIKGALEEVTRDLTEVEDLYKEIRGKFAGHQKQHDAEKWSEWKAGWFDRVQGIADRNDLRYSLWVVWIERQARMRVGGMCELLRRMLVYCGNHLEGTGEISLERLSQFMIGFHDYFEEAIEVIGINAPLNPAVVGPVVEAYEASLAPLRSWLEKNEGDAAELSGAVRSAGLSALFELPPLLKTRKRAYKFVNDIGDALNEVCDLLEDGGDVKAAVERHDAALRGFKGFAGLD